MAFAVILNGEPADLDLAPAPTLQQLVEQQGLRSDRVAIEHNGQIVPRTRWTETVLSQQDRLEIVHFVGGGCR